MDKYFDQSGIEIDNAKIQCIDSVKGTGKIFIGSLAINAKAVVSVNTFIGAAAWHVMVRAIAWSQPVHVTPFPRYIAHTRKRHADFSSSGSSASACCTIKDFRVQSVV